MLFSLLLNSTDANNPQTKCCYWDMNFMCCWQPCIMRSICDCVCGNNALEIIKKNNPKIPTTQIMHNPNPPLSQYNAGTGNSGNERKFSAATSTTSSSAELSFTPANTTNLLPDNNDQVLGSGFSLSTSSLGKNYNNSQTIKSFKNIKALILDDEIINIQVMKKILNSFAISDIETNTKASNIIAIEELKSFDLFCCDYNLKEDMNGIAFYKLIESNLKEYFFMLVTGDKSDELNNKALELQKNDKNFVFIKKPPIKENIKSLIMHHFNITEENEENK